MNPLFPLSELSVGRGQSPVAPERFAAATLVARHPSSSADCHPRREAFTLIELLVVVAVIAILAGITLAALGGINQKGARDRTRAEIAGIVNALERYKSQNDLYPAASGPNLPFAAISAFMPQVNPDGNLTNLSDPYGNTYLYRFPGTRNIATFDVWSPGQDTNASATNDDIGNW